MLILFKTTKNRVINTKSPNIEDVTETQAHICEKQPVAEQREIERNLSRLLYQIHNDRNSSRNELIL